MNVEDSYEGAVRRLRRLGHAGFDLAPPALAKTSAEADDRMRDLEELATLACDDNERLTRELDGAHEEIDRLRRQVTTLQEMLASAPSDDPFAAPKQRGRGLALFLFTLVIVGGAAAALFVLRPWQRPAVAPAVTVVAAPAPPPSAPIVAAPPPSIPTVAPTIPKVEPVAATPTVVPPPRASEPPREAAPAKSRSQRRHAAKHHSSKSARHGKSKHGSTARAASKPGVRDTDDPLGGLDL